MLLVEVYRFCIFQAIRQIRSELISDFCDVWQTDSSLQPQDRTSVAGNLTSCNCPWAKCGNGGELLVSFPKIKLAVLTDVRNQTLDP